MTATEAARSFSELLSRVAAGEEIKVTRSGVEVALISPPKSRLVSAGRFRELIATAPLPDGLCRGRACRMGVGRTAGGCACWRHSPVGSARQNEWSASAKAGLALGFSDMETVIAAGNASIASAYPSAV